MNFLIYCVDKPGHAYVRAENRPAHLEYVSAYADRMLAAGPTLADDGETPTGSVFLIEFADRAAAEAFSAGDPYNQAGLFESVEIKPFRKVLPK